MPPKRPHRELSPTDGIHAVHAASVATAAALEALRVEWVADLAANAGRIAHRTDLDRFYVLRAGGDWQRLAEPRLRQVAAAQTTGTTPLHVGALSLALGDVLRAGSLVFLGNEGTAAAALAELVHEASGVIVATWSTVATLEAVALVSDTTIAVAGLHTLRIRGAAPGASAIFRGLDWMVR